jgi:hypothetical protein
VRPTLCSRARPRGDAELQPASNPTIRGLSGALCPRDLRREPPDSASQADALDSARVERFRNRRSRRDPTAPASNPKPPLTPRQKPTPPPRTSPATVSGLSLGLWHQRRRRTHEDFADIELWQTAVGVRRHAISSCPVVPAHTPECIPIRHRARRPITDELPEGRIGAPPVAMPWAAPDADQPQRHRVRRTLAADSATQSARNAVRDELAVLQHFQRRLPRPRRRCYRPGTERLPAHAHWPTVARDDTRRPPPPLARLPPDTRTPHSPTCIRSSWPLHPQIATDGKTGGVRSAVHQSAASRSASASRPAADCAAIAASRAFRTAPPQMPSPRIRSAADLPRTVQSPTSRKGFLHHGHILFANTICPWCRTPLRLTDSLLGSRTVRDRR